MVPLLRRILIASCTVIAVAAAVWCTCASTIATIECSLTEPFDEPGGSGYRQHLLVLRIDRSVTLAHYADWRASPEQLKFEGHYESPISGASRFRVRSLPHRSGLNWEMSAPAWGFGVFGLLPLAAWIDQQRARRRTQRLRRTGCCPACGYDLRASKDRCPECGRPISSA
jgi:hypothetical protein